MPPDDPPPEDAQPDSVHPENGVRFECRLQTAADPVVYALDVRSPEAIWRGSAVVHLESGNVELRWEPSDVQDAPPKWATDTLARLLRSYWRAQGEPGAAWPRRLTRWRSDSR